MRGEGYDWPGNVRELERAIERFLALGESALLLAGRTFRPAGQADRPTDEDGPAAGDASRASSPRTSGTPRRGSGCSRSSSSPTSRRPSPTAEEMSRRRRRLRGSHAGTSSGFVHEGADGPPGSPTPDRISHPTATSPVTLPETFSGNGRGATGTCIAPGRCLANPSGTLHPRLRRPARPLRRLRWRPFRAHRSHHAGGHERRHLQLRRHRPPGFVHGRARRRHHRRHADPGVDLQRHRLAVSFELDIDGSGGFFIVNTQSGKCVDVQGAGAANGTKVQLWDCNQSGAQTFVTRDAGNGFVFFVNSHSNKCLDVQAAHPDDGTLVQLYDCNGTNAQRWNPGKRHRDRPGSGGGSAPAPPARARAAPRAIRTRGSTWGRILGCLRRQRRRAVRMDDDERRPGLHVPDGGTRHRLRARRPRLPRRRVREQQRRLDDAGLDSHVVRREFDLPDGSAVDPEQVEAYDYGRRAAGATMVARVLHERHVERGRHRRLAGHHRHHRGRFELLVLVRPLPVHVGAPQHRGQVLPAARPLRGAHPDPRGAVWSVV